MNKLYKYILLVIICIILNCPSVFADTTIFNGDVNGGVITDLGGAQINANTSNYAQIGITGNGNVIKWDTFNIGKNNHLDFNFTQAGQVALNKVLGGQMSTIAGQLSTSGEAGRLIISNPVGMLFDKGVVVNANSLILTTKDVNWDGNLFGRLELTDNVNGLNSSIKIIDNKTSNFVIADDLNIIAPNIEVKQANDFLVNNSTRLITTDGVTFIANSPNIETSIDANNAADTGKVYVFDSKIAFQNLDTGRIYVASRGDINFEKSTIKNADLNAAKNIIVKGGTMYTNYIDNSTLTAKTSITVSNHNSINNSALRLTDTAKLDEIKITINSNNNNHTRIFNSDLQGRFIYANKSAIESSVLNTTKDMNISGATVEDSIFNSGFKVIAENVNIKDSELTGTNTMTFDKFSVLDNVKITLNNTMNFGSPGASTVHLNDATLLNGSEVHSPKICANRSTIDNSSITATNDLSIIDGVLRNGSEVTSKYFIHDRHNVVTRDNSADNITVENSTLTAESDLLIRNGNLSNAVFNTPNTLTIIDSTVSSDLDVNNINTLTISDTNLQKLNTENVNNINLNGIIATEININNSENVVIQSSNTIANELTPSIIEQINNSVPITNYDDTKYTPESFENKINGNKYGEGFRISSISGDVNINNTKNIDIINTGINGSLNETNCSGKTNLIATYIAEYFNPSTTNIETSVYQSVYTIPVIDEPIIDEPIIDEPIINEPIIDEPIIDEPIIDEPVIDEPIIDKPIISEIINEIGDVDIEYINDNDKNKFGIQVNTDFYKEILLPDFSVRGKELKKRIQITLLSAKPGKNNSILIIKPFIAE